MKLHIFNPEHDIALAANQPRFTAPHAGRQLRADLGFIPALWAADGDMVLVDDVEAAMESVRHVRRYAHDVLFVSMADLGSFSCDMLANIQIEPWGWDCTVKEQLVRANAAFGALVPSDEALSSMRIASSRRFAAERMLPQLRVSDALVGESRYCDSWAEAADVMRLYGRSVLKSPWSSSGRGVRYVHTSEPESQLVGWVRNVIRQQGGIMVEPLYRRICDFGMEFFMRSDGVADYCGLSVFDTNGGAYTGSVCATEADKRSMLSQYVCLGLLDSVCSRIQSLLGTLLAGVYVGPLGIDMMAVGSANDDTVLLHPCVEMNLRRTMGHVALALSPSPFEPQRLMGIYYAGKYRLRIRQTAENVLNTGLC